MNSTINTSWIINFMFYLKLTFPSWALIHIVHLSTRNPRMNRWCEGAVYRPLWALWFFSNVQLLLTVSCVSYIVTCCWFTGSHCPDRIWYDRREEGDEHWCEWPSSVTEAPKLKGETVNVQAELAGGWNPSKSASGHLLDNDAGPALQNVLVLVFSRDYNSLITTQGCGSAPWEKKNPKHWKEWWRRALTHRPSESMELKRVNSPAHLLRTSLLLVSSD